MKIKNLLLVPLLSAALVATSCSPSNGGSSSSGTETTSGESQKAVTRVTVKSVQSVVVGDELDFDTLVDVYYSDDSKDKDYTLEAAAASKDSVKIEGKKVTILKEGSISINVKAGEQQAKFNTTALSQLKKDVYAAYNDVTNNYKVSITVNGTDWQLRKVHRPNYYYTPSYPSGELQNGRGMLKFANGHGYEYTVSSGAFNLGKRNDNYDLYFSAMDLDLKVLEMTTLSEEGVDFLRLPSSVETDWHEYGYFNHVHFLMYTLTGLSFTDVYYDANDQYLNPAAGTEYTRWEQIDIAPVTDEGGEFLYYGFSVYTATYVVAEHEDPTEEYEYFGEDDQIKEGTSPALTFGMKITPLEEEAPEFTLVEDFVADPENEPHTKDYTKVKNFAATTDVAPHNFTATVASYFYSPNRSTSPVVDWQTTEVYSANEDVYDIAVTGGKVTDYGQYWAPADVSRAQGYAVKNDQLYVYTREDTGGTAQASAGKSSIYNDAQVKANTFAYLATEALYSEGSLFVESVTLDETEHTETYTLVAADSLVFLKGILGAFDGGFYYLQCLDSYWGEDDRVDEFLGYADASITLLLDDTNTTVEGLQFDLDGMIANFGSTVGYIYFRTSVTLNGFGTTADVDLTGIDFPPVS